MLFVYFFVLYIRSKVFNGTELTMRGVINILRFLKEFLLQYEWIWQSVLLLLFLFTPIFTLQYGPSGKAYYGDGVPYIIWKGSYLFGKLLDSFWPLVLSIQYSGIIVYVVILVLEKQLRWRSLGVLFRAFLCLFFLFIWNPMMYSALRNNADAGQSELIPDYGPGYYAVVLSLILSSIVFVFKFKSQNSLR